MRIEKVWKLCVAFGKGIFSKFTKQSERWRVGGGGNAQQIFTIYISLFGLISWKAPGYIFTSSLSAKQRRARQHATFRTVQGTLRIWRGFVTIALVNCIYLELKWMNQFECTVHCMQCAVQLNYWEPVWLELREYTEYKQYKLLETRSAILCTHTI